MTDRQAPPPLHVFRFKVEFAEIALTGGETESGKPVVICSGAFSECTGLEATMEPKVIREGGRNFGVHQRVGLVTFATVILKRGVTTERDLWKWFELVGRGAYAHRMKVTIKLLAQSSQEEVLVAWELDRALPVKFKAADLNARASEVGIEELHLAHQGLKLVR